MPTQSVSMLTPDSVESDKIARSRRMAEMLQAQSMQQDPMQMVGGQPVAPSWTQGLAKILQGYGAGMKNEEADTQAKALQAQQQERRGADMQTLISALQGRPAQPAGLQEDASGNVTPTDAIQGMTPQQSLQQALPRIQDPQMQQIAFGQMMSGIQRDQAPPERIDLGDKIGLYKNGVLIGSLPKGATPDASLREAGSDRRHQTASGSATLGANTSLSIANQTDARARAEGAANRATTERGQTMTNDRARELAEANRENKPLTESQAKASVFHSQMTSASDALAKIPGYDPNSGMTQADTAVAGGRGNMIASETAQRAKQAQSQWAEAFLRFKTGAASTPAEVALNVATFFPQIGDKPGVIAQKALMRQQAERDLSLATGRKSVIQNAPDNSAAADPLGLRG
jgi:hypothetical protein